ncbi:NAD(+) synthase [Candidatus Saccharibacteria bacterium]|nr:NAD(+) synthase [Candidatus Saccharibacteria bacterium]
MNKLISNDYFKVAVACPEVSITDTKENTARIIEIYNKAVSEKVALVVFPELSITGYSLGDIVHNKKLLKDALHCLYELSEKTAGKSTCMIVGLPLVIENTLYNVGAVLAEGQIKGIVPKKNMPNYGEFYEKRWFSVFDGETKCSIDFIDIDVSCKNIPFGDNLVFDIGGIKVGVEICEDLWVADPPNRKLAKSGAIIIANLSASPEIIGKSEYRKQLVTQTSAQLICGYLYAGADQTESTIDTVLSGHQLISENGHVLAEREPFSPSQRLTIAEVDVSHLAHDRIKDTNRQTILSNEYISTIKNRLVFTPKPIVIADPFLPGKETKQSRNIRLSSIVNIQATGLAERLRTGGHKGVALGLSGGLDSTLALLIALKACKILNKKPQDTIFTLTMPGLASSNQTQNNAKKLARLLHANNLEIPISTLSQNQLKAIGHDSTSQDTTYENTQARIRTSLLFNYANNEGLIVLGTGDLSEIALGWSTFGADHLSHYNVNCTVPKTLVRHLVKFLSEQPDFKEAKKVLQDVIDTPISPELVSSDINNISQKTEELIGPYELHDFFLYYLVRWGDSPEKILFLANIAFAGKYTDAEIKKWLKLFLDRFIKNQFKRSVMPDGPKIGSVALSPRGDWRMPSDIPSTSLWE